MRDQSRVNGSMYHATNLIIALTQIIDELIFGYQPHHRELRMVLDRNRLYNAITTAILPHATRHEDDEELESEDAFIRETATFLTQEIIDSNIEITEDQAELDDEQLENLPISNLSPHLNQLLDITDPIRLISNIIQIYYTANSEEPHYHIRNGPCEVSLSSLLI